MKKDIHCEYVEAGTGYNCRNPFTTRSAPVKVNREIRSACNALYASKQNRADVLGRVERFQGEYGKDYVIKEKQGKY